MKINKQQLKIFCLVIILMNLVSTVLGVVYYAVPLITLFWLWNFQGIVMLISWFLNVLLIYINDRLLVKSDDTGRKINLICYLFLVFIIIAMLLLFNYSYTFSYGGSITLINITMSIFAIFVIAIFGIILAYFDIKNLENRGVWKFE